MSWLPSFESATQALTELSSKVQESLPVDSSDLFNKLTLRSDELVREHELLDAQEKRKELVREYLSETLPWETKDESRQIFEEEAREAIMDLSKDRATFETPFLLEKGIMFNPITDHGDDEEEIEFSNDNKESSVQKKDESTLGSKIEESRLKLEKMQPLPILLEYFDIDTHVGLIQRLLKVDPGLVKMHSMLSGAGDKELTFWKNYFFHCAYIRYEKGLSIDEIWSQKPKASITEMSSPTANASGNSSNNNIMDDESSVELDFENNHDDLNEFRETDEFENPSVANHSDSPSTQSTTESGNSYEIVNNDKHLHIEGDDDNGIDDLDDLEAEIARELGED